jgi:hypothetical protein
MPLGSSKEIIFQAGGGQELPFREAKHKKVRNERWLWAGPEGMAEDAR